MTSQLFRLPIRPILLGVPLGLCLSYPLTWSNPSSTIRCDYAPPLAHTSQESPPRHLQELNSQNKGVGARGGVSASTVRQISLGSVLGLLAGLGLRIFSRPLAFSMGLGILFIEWAASKGYNVVPTRWLQRHVKSFDVRRAMTQNIPFKASFGSSLILAAFTDFMTQEQ